MCQSDPPPQQYQLVAALGSDHLILVGHQENLVSYAEEKSTIPRKCKIYLNLVSLVVKLPNLGRKENVKNGGLKQNSTAPSRV